MPLRMQLGFEALVPSDRWNAIFSWLLLKSLLVSDQCNVKSVGLIHIANKENSLASSCVSYNYRVDNSLFFLQLLDPIRQPFYFSDRMLWTVETYGSASTGGMMSLPVPQPHRLLAIVSAKNSSRTRTLVASGVSSLR